ncbi:hypothetical protein FAQ01_26490 [Flavobacterium aquatile]|nr:hypothetical protein FAQ01_26490 [Flavobacterium aquatile]
MTELLFTVTVSESPLPAMAPIKMIPKKKIMQKINKPTIVANTFPKNLIIVFLYISSKKA